MRSLKGQASVEFLVIVIAGLILIGVVAFFLFSQKGGVGSRSEIDSAQLIVNDVSKAADDVFIQGPGSSKKIQITVSESTDLNNSGILEKTVFLSLQGTRVFSNSKVKMTGSFPKQKGFQDVFLNARADYVFVGESRIFLSQYFIFAELVQGDNASESIVLRNEGNSPLTVQVSKEFDSSIVFLEVNSSNFSLASKESKTIVLDFTARPLGLGQASGKLNIQVSGNDYSEKAVIPITVSVKASKATASGSLRIIPNSWTASLKSGESVSKTFKVCNQANSTSGAVNFAKLEIFSKELPRTEGGIVWSVFEDNDFVYAGMQDGGINVWMKDLTFFKKVSETASAIRAVASNSDFVFAGSSDGNVYVLDKEDFSLKSVLVGNSGPITSLAIDGQRIYAGTSSGKIIIWDNSAFNQLANFSNSAESVNSLSLGSDSIFAGSSDGNVYVWKKSDLSFERILAQPSSPVNSVFADSDFLFAGTQDGKVFVYSLSDFSLVNVISKSLNSIKQLYSSPAGNFLAVAAADSGVYFFSRPEFIETFNASAGKMMQGVYGNEGTVLLGTGDSEVFAINYSEFVSKIASYWINDLQSLDSIPAQSCSDKNFTITIPPSMTSNSFFGDLNINSADEGFDVLQIQVNVE
ncbi:MAG: hypothetical protein Q7R70_01800 [Candidatus Diapherotrites archaeon]|nr:hypothetical protein [Candidatus Diapherotrites archaeon]